jgi:hypothetical protein
MIILNQAVNCTKYQLIHLLKQIFLALTEVQEIPMQYGDSLVLTNDHKKEYYYKRWNMEKGESKKVILWTRQDIKSLDDLKKKGRIRISRRHLELKFEELTDYIVELYDWFVSVASEKVARPQGVEYPIWCSISEENMLRPTMTEVVYVLEVDSDEIIYFDGQKWDYVLNHHYVAKDGADMKAYTEEMDRKGFRDTFSIMNSNTAHFYPQEIKRIKDSWMRVFEIDDWNIFNVQANIWEIRPEMIKYVVTVDGPKSVNEF